MSRRVSLPGASELFRTTQAEVGLTVVPTPESTAIPGAPDERNASTVAPPDPRADEPASEPPPRRGTAASSRRVRHDEKITVYVSIEELLALEEARLRLRADHGVAVDRGRIVREAISAAMADLSERGGDSDLVRRLTAP